jgi:hypothetical protein
VTSSAFLLVEDMLVMLIRLLLRFEEFIFGKEHGSAQV